jgi:hypothetical protein
MMELMVKRPLLLLKPLQPEGLKAVLARGGEITGAGAENVGVKSSLIGDECAVSFLSCSLV